MDIGKLTSADWERFEQQFPAATNWIRRQSLTRWLAEQAAIFFHGCQPTVRGFNGKYVWIESTGYACD